MWRSHAPRKLVYGSSGVGGSLHLAAELLSYPREFADHLRNEMLKLRKVVAAAKLPLQ